MMNFARWSPDKTINILLKRIYSVKRKNHYDVLNLQKNCSAKEIKEAFIKMSKKYHPDKNKDVNAQEKFVRVLEAYNVLSKPSSRSQYDSMSDFSRNAAAHTYRPSTSYNRHSNAQAHYSYYYANYGSANPNNSNTWQQKQQAPINKKIPNLVIILMCIGFALIGFVVQISVIRQTFIANQRRAEEKSKLIGEELERVRSAAAANGNELQTRLLLDKIAAGSNPTVATASLGAALANEQKNASAGSLLAQLGIIELPPLPAVANSDVKEYEKKESNGDEPK